jgi:parvulin-like peptidyl-prolyl isomerase
MNSKEIIITEDETKKLIAFWKKRYHKTPTQKELGTLLDVYIENKILYTEALNIKLDQDDEAIKQLLVDKLKYIVSEPIDINTISDKTLETFFNENKQLFSNNTSSSITFSHIYFNPKETHEKEYTLEEKAKSIYLKLKNKPFDKKDTLYGNPFYKGSYFSKMTKKELSKIFTHSFVQELQKLPLNQWSKPIKSGYGIHLIYIEEIKQTDMTFKDIKETVKNNYIIHTSKNNYEKFYKDVKKRYNITIKPYTISDEK